MAPTRHPRATSQRDIPAGNEYLLYLEGLKTASPEAFQEVVSGVSGVALMEEPERSAERPLSGDVARVLERVVEWRVQFAMSPGSREPHPVNSAARLRVSLDDLAGALGLKEEAVRRLEMLAGKRVKGGVLTIASRGWRTREDNRRQAMEVRESGRGTEGEVQGKTRHVL